MINPIKVRVNGKWISAMLINRSGSNEKANVELLSGQQIVVEPEDIKKFLPLDYDRPSDHVLKSMFDEIKLLLRHTMPDEVERVNLDLHGATITGYRDYVALSSTIIEVQTIGSIREVFGWQVSTFSHVPSTQWEPENYDENVIGEYRVNVEAVEAFVKQIFSMKIKDYFQAKFDSEMAESL